MHTTRGVWPTACRPDVHPRELPRRRMRQTDTDKVFAVIHVVHGAEVLMRTHAWDIDFISSAVSRRRRIKLQHDAGVSPPAFDPIAATRCGSTTHRAAPKGSRPKALRGDCAEGQLKLARGTPPSSKLARGKPPRRKGHGGRRSCGLPRKFGPHEQLLSHLPTYRPSHPSHLLTSLLPDVSPYLLFLLLPLVLQLRASARHCLVVFLPSRAAAHIVQQDVDARARRSLSKTLDGGHAAPLSQSQKVQSPILQ